MIKIICFGKLKENYLINAVNDYFERINKYHKISILELKDSENILREITNIFVENIRIYLTGYYNKKQDILDKIIEQCNRYIRKETGKKPVIIPEIIEIN